MIRELLHIWVVVEELHDVDIVLDLLENLAHCQLFIGRDIEDGELLGLDEPLLASEIVSDKSHRGLLVLGQVEPL